MPRTRDIGPTIKEYRSRHTLTQFQFADLVGTSQETVSRWERNISAPSSSMETRLKTMFQRYAPRLDGPVLRLWVRLLATPAVLISPKGTVAEQSDFARILYGDSGMSSGETFAAIVHRETGHNISALVEKTGLTRGDLAFLAVYFEFNWSGGHHFRRVLFEPIAFPESGLGYVAMSHILSQGEWDQIPDRSPLIVRVGDIGSFLTNGRV